MNLQPIIDRIAAQCLGFKLVGGAADYTGLDVMPPAMPACFVIPLAERVADTTGLSFVLQRVEVDFAVLFAVGNVKSARGVEGLDDLDTLRQSVRTALLNYKMTDYAPISYVEGALTHFQPGLMWWQDGYRTAHHIQST